jgi:hypothetical protein
MGTIIEERTGRNTIIVMVLALGLSIFAMWRMEYLWSPRAEYVRMTDSARNAYVAKNLVEGRGYSTNDIPSALIGFYSQKGKLQEEHWPNADRFPFSTFAIAGLYLVTQHADWWVGITLYNIIAFTLLLTLIYRLSLSIFKNHYSGVIAVTVALLHSSTWFLLYQKDADTVALTVGALIALIRWLDTPREQRARWALVLGTLMAWLFLARPNVGMPFMLYLAFGLLQWIRDREGLQGQDKLRAILRVYGALAGAFALWTLPYAVYTTVVWGSPFFSANSLYQLPLGTRLSLGGDTWWKYYGPDRVLAFSTLFAEVPREIIWKVVSSWILTFRLCLSSYISEAVVLLMARLTIWSPDGKDRDPRVRPSVRAVGKLLLGVSIFNFAILPLFGWAYFPWKQYLMFAMPWVWVFVGHAVFRFIQIARARIPDDRATQYLFAFAALLVVVAFIGGEGGYGDGLFVTPNFSRMVWSSWIPVAIALGIIVIFRPRRMTPLGGAALAFVGVLVVYHPAVELKSDNINYYPLTKNVKKTLRERHGLVSSLALQSEVSWLTGRKHIPVPENPLLLYSYHSDFGLDVEDVYIESAQTMVTPPGPFSKFMPSLEAYARLERYEAPLPGYEIVLHETGQMNYSKYRVSSRPKASTIYRLTDPKARDAVQTSPEKLELGDIKNAVHLTHGFGGYYDLEGRRVAALSDVTRKRYRRKPPAPHEDGAVSFFLDQRMPKSVTVSLYFPGSTKLDVYWNLDLDAYDLAKDRKAHQIGSITATEKGWQTVTFELPPGLPRTGLNKLGVRASQFTMISGCTFGTEFCAAAARDSAKPGSTETVKQYATLRADDGGGVPVSGMVESISFTY